MEEYAYTYQGDEYYCFSGTNVLRNKQGIMEKEALNVAEREITSIKIAMLLENPIRGSFGFTHLCNIHKFIFYDIYDWAGRLRQGEFLMKGNSIFCRGQYIKSSADRIFEQLKKENKLRKLKKESFIERLSFYMGEVNALHPFREGNGRASREFFRELAYMAGYNCDFRVLNKDEHLEADISAFNKNYKLLIKLLKIAVRER